jgi:hypothetical protein
MRKREWVAVWTSLLADPHYVHLSRPARSALVELWLRYALREERPWQSKEDLLHDLGVSERVLKELEEHRWLEGLAPRNWRLWQLEWRRRADDRERKAQARQARDGQLSRSEATESLAAILERVRR